ncbi:aspartic proteinase Asp1-like [Cicer arietinum]|uniref:Aspartic proteinase Asp1 n=1 Tax=Cicer arietinum TaxID=3827 RepID=A0A1S2YBT7_CICAR|nr:aspartic proteinase Asp1-like [Cicer arietinum]
MDVKNRGVSLIILSLFLLLSSIFSSANRIIHNNNLKKNPISFHSLVSSTIYSIQGNVYPLGFYTVTLNIGNPPKPYDLDIDTGSDITWIQCDAPCTGCTKPVEQLYKPHNNIVKCTDPVCAAIQNHHCDDPNHQCDYEVLYVDHGSSLGVLVRDNFPIGTSSSGSLLQPLVAFGCGYDQEFSGPNPPPDTIGVLGLGSGKTSILSQLSSQGYIRNVLGHCLSSKGGGYLFFGDQFVPSSGINWTPLIQNSPEQHYNTGPADILFNGMPTSVKNIQLIFDSGSSYTYFNSEAYNAVVALVKNDVKGKLSDASDDPSLPICWKGAEPFKSLSDVDTYFKPLDLSFSKSNDLYFHLPPSAYLIITEHGNVCLGILDGSQVDLGDLNVIGDIFLQDKVVIYDNENKRVGWASADCNTHPHP